MIFEKVGGPPFLEQLPTKAGRVVTIRPVVEQDAPGLVAHLQRVAREGLLGVASFRTAAQEAAFIVALNPALYLYLAALDGDLVVGNIIATRGDTATMNHLVGLAMALDPPYRGQGIGSRLLDRALTWAKAAGAEKAILSVLAINAPALGLYRKFGFQVEGRRSRQYRKITGDGYDDEILMGKFL